MSNLASPDNQNPPIFFENVFNACEIGLIILDQQACVVNWNAWFTLHSSIALEDARGKPITELFPILRNSSLERAINQALNHKMSSVVSFALNRAPFPLLNLSAQTLSQHTVIKPLKNKSSSNTGYCLIQITDISAAIHRGQRLAEQIKQNKFISDNLAQAKERANVTLNSIADAVITTDATGLIKSMNSAAEKLTGVGEREAIDQPVNRVVKLINEKTQQPIESPVMRCLDNNAIVLNDLDHTLVNNTGNQYAIAGSVAPIFNNDQTILGAVLVFRDVTHSRSLSAELNWQAEHDHLTGLPNRRVFEARMKRLLDISKKSIQPEQHFLLYLDLDQFKVVNDTCGHDAGDELLRQITDTFQQRIRKTDLLARLGGDEFGVLLESCTNDVALRIAHDIRQGVHDFRFGWQQQSFKIGVSIGIAVITGKEAKAAEILSAADAACYVAKDQGRNRVHLHQLDASGSSVQQQEMQWIARIQEALDNDRFVLFAQRIQDIKALNEESRHYEILIRMRDAENKLIPPGAFLPAAERFNLIAQVDRWVLDKVLSVLAKHGANNPTVEKLVFSINLSGASMADEGLLVHIVEQLDKHTICPKTLCFEVTETAAIANLTTAIKFLTVLREKGCKVALDDFGSGLSSFAYLKTLPVDYLKIDGHFVKDIAIDPIDRAFVDTINKIAQVMGLETIAEFVENDAILAILSDLGVNYAQGYGVHKPCPLLDIL